MAQKSNRFERFWKELKRRKVVQVITAYIAVAFGILQLVDIVIQPLNLPAGTLKYLIIILCIGFLVVAIFSWIYDITSSGVKKTESLDSIESEKETPIPKQSNAWKIISYISIAVIIILISLNIINWSNKEDLSKLEKSIALLPFRNDTPVDSNKYFIIGVVEDIRNHLQTIGDLKPTSRTSAEKYNNTTKTIPEIGKELGVNYVVEGSGQRSGNKIQLNLYLFRATKESPLWSKSYVQQIDDATDIFKLQSQIAESIAAEIEAVITPLEKQIIEKTPTSSLAAYENYILGENYIGRYTEEDLDIALQYFEKAKEIDPYYALAYVGITDVWIMRAIFSYPDPKEAASNAKSNAAKAFELDSTSSGAYVALGKTQAFIDYDFKSAEKSLKKCISLNPNNSYGHSFYGDLLTMLGRSKEALEQSEISLKLDPMNVGFRTDYGLNLFCAGRYNEAIAIFQEVLKTYPLNSVALGNLPLALHKIGKFNEELEVWKLYYNTVFKDYVNVFDQGYIKGGLTSALNLQADSLLKQSRTKFIQPCEIAQIYACAGNMERTLDMLERDYEVNDPNLPFILRYPIYEFVHNEPRFQNLFHKINLPFK
jgi:TolB-like protein